MAGEIASTAAAEPAKSDDEKALVVHAPAAAASSGPFVQYTGPQTGSGSLATISVNEWSQAGFAAKHGHEWKLQNNWRLPVAQFSPEQLAHLLDVDKRFVLVDAAGEKVDR